MTARTCLYSGPRQSTRTRCLQVGITFLANKTTPHEFASTHDKTLRSHVGVKLQNTASDRSHFIIHTSRHQPTVAPRPLPVHPSRQEALHLVQIILPKKQVVEKRATTSLAPTILCFRWEIPPEDCMYPGNPPHLISPPSPLPPCLWRRPESGVPWNEIWRGGRWVVTGLGGMQGIGGNLHCLVAW